MIYFILVELQHLKSFSQVFIIRDLMASVPSLDSKCDDFYRSFLLEINPYLPHDQNRPPHLLIPLKHQPLISV